MEIKNSFNPKVIDDAIDKGVQYLFSQTVNGRWKGFPTLAGVSDIWVTGFVLSHIYSVCKHKDLMKESLDFLVQSRHSSGGWSYSALVPPDADSTAWCLVALQLSKVLTEAELEKAKIFLWSHFKDKGISTYTVDSGIREFISATDNETIAGWTSPHPDVSISAVLADAENEKVAGIINWLISQQTNEGFINSYWWRGPHYATTLLLRVLTQLKFRLPYERAAKIAGALGLQQLSDGGFVLDSATGKNSFTTALALESFIHLYYLGKHTERIHCGNALLHLQNENGGWPEDYILRIPAPFMLDPDQVVSWSNAHGGGNSFIKDIDGIFATAMACYALNCWKEAELQKELSAMNSFLELADIEKSNYYDDLKTHTL